MRIEAYVISDVGKVRKNNEDNYYLHRKIRQDLDLLRSEDSFISDDDMLLFAIADGMGGEEDGELASLVTVQNLVPCHIEDVEVEACDSIMEANDMICSEMELKSGKRMGSTLVALYIDKAKAQICNVGDSRAYLLRDENLHQMSLDHTVAQQMVNMGAITAEEARGHKKSHILTQNIGIFNHEMIIEPEFSDVIELRNGDIFLLCSDGLTDMLTNEQIGSVLRSGDVKSKAEGLVEWALVAGGKDNVTALVVKVES